MKFIQHIQEIRLRKSSFAGLTGGNLAVLAPDIAPERTASLRTQTKMGFCNHIRNIYSRLEDRKEEEYRKILFGSDGDMETEIGLAMAGVTAIASHTTFRHSQTIGGVRNNYTNGSLTSSSMRIPGTNTSQSTSY